MKPRLILSLIAAVAVAPQAMASTVASSGKVIWEMSANSGHADLVWIPESRN